MEAFESPREAPWPPRAPWEEGGCIKVCAARGVGGPLDYSCQTALGILPRLNVPGSVVADVAYVFPPNRGEGDRGSSF